LNNPQNHITIFEHETIRFDKGEKRITEKQFSALKKYFGDGVPFYEICHNGVQFKEFVGVIQIGNTLIEVLPKADQAETNESKWRDILIGMLRAVGSFDIKSTSDSHLQVKPNSILDLYFELFISELEYLLRNGLLKQYRKHEGNVGALKGSLKFGQHIQQNLTHQERFYVRYSTYDLEHHLHYILYKTLRLVKRINTCVALQSRIGALLLYFPEMPDIKVSESTFNKIVFNRKNTSYRNCINIARLLLLQYHPDVIKGRNDVLALMFDMNMLWEKFVFVSLRKCKPVSYKVEEQLPKGFWKPEYGNRTTIRPDIVITNETGDRIVLDTKWKILSGGNPTAADLQQMFAYNIYFGAKKVALVYPGPEYNFKKGYFLHTQDEKLTDHECGLITLCVEPNIKQWQVELFDRFYNWLQMN
jgi:5-methylcytosine-specific restriction enzyme subunit McrC